MPNIKPISDLRNYTAVLSESASYRGVWNKGCCKGH